MRIRGRHMPMLVHRDSGYHVKFGFIEESEIAPLGFDANEFDGGFCLVWSPAKDTFRGSAFGLSWKQVGLVFDKWLSNLAREIQQVDPWHAFERLRQQDEAGLSKNDPLTPKEQKRIAAVLDDIAEDAKRRDDITQSQMAALQETVQGLKESSSRLGRKDWVMGFMGNWIWWAVTTGVRSQVFQDLVGTVGDKLSFVWSSLPHLLKSL
jgi:hypothetical protein